MAPRSIRSAAVLAALIVQASLVTPPHRAAHAQNYPTGPVAVVVSFPPGGSIDVVLRAMAPKLQERMGRPVVVENRAGGGGVIATAAVAKSAPDGHTLLAAASSLASNPALFKALPFDTLKDLQMVALLFRTPLVLVVNPSLPAQSVGELIALARQKPGEISFAQSGPGSAVHLAAELFQAMTGTRMNGIAYRGAPPALNDVMAGHVALMFADTGSVMSLIAGGKVRPLGVTSTARVPSLPGVPTIAESGVAGFDAEGWTMIAVPAATPRPIVERLQAEMVTAAATPDVRALIVRLGLIPVASPPPPALQKFLASEIDRWGGIIEKAGVAKSQ
ncbi:MAG: tripartite tricarboxylate transporter substrate binding protein [Xanthobacteraceae bacterium]|nr:tripartite tricarboxylate transporter substrate binding protein [Xanthobacteraceae bacterium]